VVGLSWQANALIFGGLFSGALLAKILPKSNDTGMGCRLDAQKNASLRQLDKSMAPKRHVDSVVIKRTASSEGSYYKRRTTKSEPHKSLQQRPHAKQRGLVQIPPIHQAAEDGLAEWMHLPEA
jgi:hypothetical protein